MNNIPAYCIIRSQWRNTPFVVCDNEIYLRSLSYVAKRISNYLNNVQRKSECAVKIHKAGEFNFLRGCYVECNNGALNFAKTLHFEIGE